MKWVHLKKKKFSLIHDLIFSPQSAIYDSKSLKICCATTLKEVCKSAMTTIKNALFWGEREQLFFLRLPFIKQKAILPWYYAILTSAIMIFHLYRFMPIFELCQHVITLWQGVQEKKWNWTFYTFLTKGSICTKVGCLVSRACV